MGPKGCPKTSVLHQRKVPSRSYYMSRDYSCCSTSSTLNYAHSTSRKLLTIVTSAQTCWPNARDLRRLITTSASPVAVLKHFASWRKDFTWCYKWQPVGGAEIKRQQGRSRSRCLHEASNYVKESKHSHIRSKFWKLFSNTDKRICTFPNISFLQWCTQISSQGRQASANTALARTCLSLTRDSNASDTCPTSGQGHLYVGSSYAHQWRNTQRTTDTRYVLELSTFYQESFKPWWAAGGRG
jgi:hypothetical protein